MRCAEKTEVVSKFFCLSTYNVYFSHIVNCEGKLKVPNLNAILAVI